MKSIRIVAVLVVAVGYMAIVNAQQAGPAQTSSGGPGGDYTMEPGMMGPNGMMGYGHMGPWMMGHGGQGASMCTAMASHIEGRLAYIKAELKITESQESLWKSYASAARDHAKAMVTHCSAMATRHGAGGLSLPERLDQHEQFMAAQLEAMRGMNKALKPLYAALDETQKRAADELFWGLMGMM